MFSDLNEKIKKEIKPEGRANAISGSLEQLQQYIPEGISLRDIVAGWFRLYNHCADADEDERIVSRRKTCGELAKLAGEIEPAESLAGAIECWTAWEEAFEMLSSESNDPRQKAMATTFQRELNELREKDSQ
jgi:hypothetical protein